MPLKPVDKKKNPGLAKLPTGVRNKMGYMKDGGAIDKKKGTRSGLAKYRKKENMTDAEARKKLFDQLDAEAKRYGQEPTPNKKKVQKKKEGGMVLEIGLRPATKQEMKMAKEMKPQKKANGGMVSRGTGQAIRGKGFKGVF